MSDERIEGSQLTDAQLAALRHVAEMAGRRQADARECLTSILRRAGCKHGILEAALESIRTHARVVLHFHPDRFGAKPLTVAEALLQEGCYRNQFETGLSSGSRF